MHVCTEYFPEDSFEQNIQCVKQFCWDSLSSFVSLNSRKTRYWQVLTSLWKFTSWQLDKKQRKTSKQCLPSKLLCHFPSKIRFVFRSKTFPKNDALTQKRNIVIFILKMGKVTVTQLWFCFGTLVTQVSVCGSHTYPQLYMFALSSFGHFGHWIVWLCNLWFFRVTTKPFFFFFFNTYWSQRLLFGKCLSQRLPVWWILYIHVLFLLAWFDCRSSLLMTMNCQCWRTTSTVLTQALFRLTRMALDSGSEIKDLLWKRKDTI